MKENSPCPSILLSILSVLWFATENTSSMHSSPPKLPYFSKSSTPGGVSISILTLLCTISFCFFVRSDLFQARTIYYLTPLLHIFKAT